jgi:Protein of unknown function (DUF2695)
MKNAAAEILTPNSDRWKTFILAVEAAVEVAGCDGEKQRHAKRIMTDMGNVDIPGSIEYFEAHGGYCDCEILMNVDGERFFQQQWITEVVLAMDKLRGR